jgi:hypothetical protein
MRQASTNVRAVNAVLVLALVILAGLVATRPPRVAPRYLNLRLVHATGTPLLLLGVLLGPASGVLSDAVLSALAPAIALAIGWAGAAFGSRIPWRVVRRIPRAVWTLAALRAGASFLAVAAGAVVLALLIPALRASWRPLAIVTLALASLAAVSRRIRGPRHVAATLETAFGALALTLVLASDHPRGPVGGLVGGAGWLILSLGSGALVGVLFVGLARLRDARDLPLALLGTVLFGAGVGYALGLSPFVVCAVAAGIIAHRAPERRAVAARLQTWEAPLYVVFLILAGALLGVHTFWIVPAAVVLAVLRVGARWAVDRYWKGVPRRRFAGLRQDGVALALALNFLLIYRVTAPAAGEAVLAVVVIGVVLAQLATAYPLLTASPAPAEVS